VQPSAGAVQCRDYLAAVSTLPIVLCLADHPWRLDLSSFAAILAAVGGLLVFAATAVLAWLAKKQMDAARAASANETKVLKEQIEASIEQGKAIREAARAQLQPMVFAHADDVRTFPDTAVTTLRPHPNEYQLGPGQTGFGYRLKNEGTGIALNIKHGVEVDGHEIAFEGGMRFRALRPGEAQPAFDYVDPLGHFIREIPWVAVADERELPSSWSSRVYWAQFDNVFGERFETRNPSDPLQAAEFKQIG
jgi:hypothetical protein